MQQVKKNLFFNIITLIVNIGVAFYYTPYLLSKIGVVAYGVIPLAMILSQYINVLATSLTGSLTRFYSVEFEEGNYRQASVYLSSSFIAILGIILITTPLFLYVVFNLETVFNVDDELLNSAKELFFFSIVSFYISLITSFLNITLYAINRLDLLNQFYIIRSSLKVVFTVLFFEIIGNDFKFIGTSNLIVEIIILLMSLYSFKKHINVNVKIKINYFEKISFILICSTSIWVLIHQLGDLAIYKTDVVLVNKFYGTKESGILNIASELGSAIMTTVGVVSSLIGPLILIAFSKKNHQEVKTMALHNTLIVGLVTSLVTGVLVGFAPEFLNLWLGREYEEYACWLSLKLIVLPFYSSAGVLAFVYRSWNKVQYPAIWTLLIGGINVVVVLLICNLSRGNVEFIKYLLICTGISTVIQSYGIGSYMFMRIHRDVRIMEIVLMPIKFVLVLLVIICVSKSIANFYLIENLYQLFICFLSVFLFGSFIIYRYLICRDVKLYLFSIVKNGK